MLFEPHFDDSLSREFREMFKRNVSDGDVIVTHEFAKPTKAFFEDEWSNRLIEYDYYGSYVGELMEREKNVRLREKSLFQFDTMELVGGKPCITYYSVVGANRLCDLHSACRQLIEFEEKMDPPCSIYFEIYVIAKNFCGLYNSWFEEIGYKRRLDVCFVFEEAFAKEELEERRKSDKRYEEWLKEDEERKAEKERRLKESQEHFDKLIEKKLEREKKHRKEFF